MKIAILSPFYCEWDGVSRVVAEQAHHLISEGHEVDIFVQRADMQYSGNGRLYILGMPKNDICISLNNLLFPLNMPKMVKWGSRLREYDMVYAFRFPMTWLAWYAKTFSGVKFVYYHTHFNPPNAFVRISERLYARLRYPMEKWVAGKADSAITISQFSRLQLRDKTGLDAKVVYIKIDSTRFHPGIDGYLIRERYGLGKVPIVLFLGHISPTKGAYDLVKAFNIVRQQLPDARLIMAGKQPYRDHLNRLKQIGGNAVLFPGVIPDNEVPLYYGACDVYATASLWEGFNIPLVEAQACGKPIVAYNIGPHPEVVKDSKTGKLVPAGNIEAFAQAIIDILRY
jgi:glycosyltransferase involved in cell wall biosynthesis